MRPLGHQVLQQAGAVEAASVKVELGGALCSDPERQDGALFFESIYREIVTKPAENGGVGLDRDDPLGAIPGERKRVVTDVRSNVHENPSAAVILKSPKLDPVDFPG